MNYKEYILYLISENYNISKVLLSEGFSLLESVEFAPQILDVLKNHGYDKPEVSKIKKVDITDDSYKITDDKNKTTETKKIGKILKMLYPDMDIVGDEKITRLMTDLNMLFKKEEETFEISNDISYWYKMLSSSCGIKSCVNNTGKSDKLLKAFDEDTNIKIVIMKGIDGKPSGRALLWTKVDGLSAPLLDRVYPINEQIKSLYHRWCDKKGYFYRDGLGFDDYREISGVERKISYNFKRKPYHDIEWMPYMDTFRFGKSDEEGNLVVFNYEPHDNEFRFDISSGKDFTIPYTFKYMSHKERLKYIKKNLIDLNDDINDDLVDQMTVKEFKYFCDGYIKIYRDLNLHNLTHLPGNFKLPKYIQRNLYLDNLTHLPDNFEFPHYIGGDVKLNRLTSLPDNVIVDSIVGGSLYLSSLTSLPDNFEFPHRIGESLYLNSLTSLPENVIFPKELFGRWINLYSLISLPDNIKNQLPKGIKIQLKNEIITT